MAANTLALAQREGWRLALRLKRCQQARKLPTAHSSFQCGSTAMHLSDGQKVLVMTGCVVVITLIIVI
jgi:hypothetical protein